jgi:hypothetical protein
MLPVKTLPLVSDCSLFSAYVGDQRLPARLSLIADYWHQSFSLQSGQLCRLTFCRTTLEGTTLCHNVCAPGAAHAIEAPEWRHHRAHD